MRRMMATLAALAVIPLALLGLQAPAQADYSSVHSLTDSSGNGDLTVYYRIKLGYSVGFKLEGVTIHADGGGLFYQGAAGKGAACWNENQVVKWSVGDASSSLDPGQSKHWDLEVNMPDASTLVCGWYWSDVFVPGDDVNQCARVLIKHSDYDLGGC